jgi:hypothetical protein
MQAEQSIVVDPKSPGGVDVVTNGDRLATITIVSAHPFL